MYATLFNIMLYLFLYCLFHCIWGIIRISVNNSVKISTDLTLKCCHKEMYSMEMNVFRIKGTVFALHLLSLLGNHSATLVKLWLL